MPAKLNVFFSHTQKDNEQYEMHSSLCEIYRCADDIHIIDVDDKYDGVSDTLCDGILQEIKKCDVFIGILTPLYDNDSGMYHINNNVLFELGYAYSCIDKENIYIFVKEDEKHKQNFERLRPSMLSSVKYKTYCSHEDIDELIKKKHADFENNSYNGFNEHALLDEGVVSCVKHDIIKMLNDNTTIEEKLHKLHNYVRTYKHNCIVEIVFLFISEYIDDNQLSYCALDWVCDFMSTILDDYWYKWIYNQNNQIKLLNLLRVVQYQLFEKFRNLNEVRINTNRMNFAILMCELLKHPIMSYKTDLEIVLNNSIHNNVHSDYDIYVKALRAWYASKSVDEKHKYEDLILFSKNDYNVYHVRCS